VSDASRITPPVLLPGFPNPVQLSLRIDLDPGEFPISDLRASRKHPRLSQMRTYQKLASAFPDAWSDYLHRHPALQKELGEAFGWATERGELNVAERRDAPILFEASLGLDQLPPLPLEAQERYQKRLREVMRRASRDLAKYRKALLTHIFELTPERIAP
jgi:hypothetical protein